MALGLSALSKLFGGSGRSRGSANSFIGLDFGSSAIKLVQIKMVKNVPTLETYGELQLGPYENVEVGRATHLPNAKLVAALKDLLTESAATGTNTGYAISYNSSYTKIISLPTLDQSQITSMLPVEAKKHVPMSLAQIELDWVSVGVDPEKKVTDVLLSAIHKDAVSRYQDIVNGAALEVLNSEIEIFSTVRSVVSPKDGMVAVIDCGASSTRLYIIDNGVIQKTHSVLLSGSGLTIALQEVLGKNFGNAEEVKRTYGIRGKGDGDKIQKTLVNNIERGFRELHTVMTRYEQGENKKIEKVILSGGASNLFGLDTYAHDMFSRPVTLAHPFAKIAYPAFLEDTVKEVGPSLSVALGVALELALNS